MQREHGTFPTPKNFNYLWNFGALATVTLVIMIATSVMLAMNLSAEHEHGVQQRAAYHARCELRLDDPLYQPQRRFNVLYGRLHPHLPRPLLWLVQGAA